MEHTNSFRRYEEGNWSPQPPQSQSQTHIYSERNDISVGSSPQTVNGYFIGSPQVQRNEKWDSYPPPASPYHSPSSPLYEAPQVVYPVPGSPLSPSTEGDRTLTSPRARQLSFSGKERVETVTARSGPGSDKAERRRCGMRRNCFYIVLVVVILLLIALGVGLGLGLSLGLKKHHSSSINADPYCRAHPEVCIGGALDPKYFTKKGAFNGSGIALAGESWNKDQRRIFTLYFQHWTGDIRFMQYTTDRKWIGGSRAETVAVDAKNSTPISAVAYSLNATQVFHIFYVTKNNTLKQMTMTNTTNIWQPGPLSNLNLKVWDNPSVGLQACWKGNYYGDSDYSKFPTSSGLQNNIPFSEKIGINIWYPIDDSTFQQYTWYQPFDQWIAVDKWAGMNGHAGVGCYSWGEGTTTYAMLVSKSNITEIHWKDTNTSLPSIDTHPINSWVNSSASIGPVYPSTSLGYTTFMFAQMADKSIRGFNVSFHAENTTVVDDDSFTITDPAGPVYGLAGTHLTNTAYTELDSGGKKVWDSLYVFYQTEGNDISAFTRPIEGGEWTKGVIKIPDD